MSIEDRINQLEAQVADLLFKYDGLVESHTSLLVNYTELTAQSAHHRAETRNTINLLCSLVGLLPEQLTSKINLLNYPDLLRKRLENQQN
ncbi:hypothetical protein [uncultured Fibrella sp.]|uniref:hypothetical protein n=1 Tax=uncultured Fibrella sp. TaxID=1284596 RepID=UPI0035CB3910